MLRTRCSGRSGRVEHGTGGIEWLVGRSACHLIVQHHPVWPTLLAWSNPDRPRLAMDQIRQLWLDTRIHGPDIRHAT